MGYDETEYTRSFDIRIWRGLLPYIRPYWKMLAAVIGLNFLLAGSDIAQPLFQRYAVDHFIVGKTLAGMPAFALLYGGMVAVMAAFVLGFTRLSMRIDTGMGRDLKQACFEHLQTLSLSYYNVTPVGYLLARIMNDTGRISELLAWNLSDILWAAVYVLGTFVAMLALNPLLALPVILLVPALALLTAYFQDRILHWNRRVRKLNSKITGAYNEGIMGARTSQTLVIEDRNFSDFSRLTEEMRASSVHTARLNAIFVPVVLGLGATATAVVLVRGGQMTMAHRMLIGTLSAFTTYAVGIFQPIQQIARNLSEFISVQTNIERVTGLLAEKPFIVDSSDVTAKYGDVFHPKPENWEPIRGDIEFEDVSFRYPDGGEDVLEHFSLKIPAGSTIAIVGETGAGKSTLVNLACRFFEPTSGRVLIDGRDIRERSQLWLHSAIGYVLQNPHLFSGTVRENIRYGRLDATDGEVDAAARAVSADRVAARLPHGYDSDVGEGGDLLSTGEKQLISFARAVLADPRIFVLDEATSSIDTGTEQLIQQAIAKILRGRTSFLIAHRLSTIRHADRILVVRGGRIIEQGTHEELLARRGAYHDLYSRQFADEATGQALDGVPG